MAKFCFFTDPAVLTKQEDDEAFGAISAEGFNVTDQHQGAGAIAVAVCDGQLRVQEAGGSLTLILKPDSQPPFDFPFISYFLYKGIDRDSLLVGGFVPEENDAEGKELAAFVHKTWKVNRNKSKPGPTALGLDLGPSKAGYENDRPLDRLFYHYPRKLAPMKVVAGDRLAAFGPQFGFEVVVEQIGRPPLLELARTARKAFPAPPLGTSNAPNDAKYFLHWHAKEAILGFVDPCAFWGAFFQRGLKASKLGENTAVDGPSLYTKVLCGTGGESGAAFVNRNRAYLDIRDEHGHSMNYYKAASVGNHLMIGFGDPDSLTTIDYYQSGWPSFWIDGVPLPSLPASATQVGIWFALPATDYSRPLAYVLAGHRLATGGQARLLPFTEQQRFIDTEPGSDPFFLKPGQLGLPLAPGSPARLAASYQRVTHFKRKAPTAVTPDPDSLVAVPGDALDYILPVPGSSPFPGEAANPNETDLTMAKTYADRVFVDQPSSISAGFVARPGVARDNANVYLFLVPTARQLHEGSRQDLADPGPAAFQKFSAFFPNYFGDVRKFSALALKPEATGNTGPDITIQVVRERTRRSRHPDLMSDFIAVTIQRIDYEPAVIVPNPQTTVLAGSELLSLTALTMLEDSNHVAYVEAIARYSRLLAPADPQDGDVISRSSSQPFPTLYALQGPSAT